MNGETPKSYFRALKEWIQSSIPLFQTYFGNIINRAPDTSILGKRFQKSRRKLKSSRYINTKFQSRKVSKLFLFFHSGDVRKQRRSDSVFPKLIIRVSLGRDYSLDIIVQRPKGTHSRRQYLLLIAERASTNSA